MKVKIQRKPTPTSVDISKEPYDKYLQNLKYWKIKDTETIIITLNSLCNYKFACIQELKMISGHISVFHKEICKVNEKDEVDSQKVQVDPIYFQKVLELKGKLKKLQKQGCFTGEKKIKSKFQQIKQQKKNLINVNLVVPAELLDSEKQQFHRERLTELYRSFVAYYPEAHSDPQLNSKLVSFLKQLYCGMKKRYFYLKQKEYFSLQMDKLNFKLKKAKYLENKKKMLAGEITVKDIVLNRNPVFENYTIKRKEQEEMIKILKESQSQLLHQEPTQEVQNQPLDRSDFFTEYQSDLTQYKEQVEQPLSFGMEKP